MKGGNIVFELDGARVVIDRLCVLLLQSEYGANVVPGFSEIAVNVNRLVVGFARVTKLAFLLKRDPHLVPQSDFVG